MPLWEPPAELRVDADAVLRGQGADPAIIRRRRPKLVETAEKALAEGQTFLRPRVLAEKLDVQAVRHERVTLEGGKKLSGPLVASHLGGAKYVVVLLATLSGELDTRIEAAMAEDLVYGMALEGVGSALVEAAANAACRYFEDRATEHGFQASIPLSPGMLGWEVGTGQPEIFKLLDADQVGVSLSSVSVMRPRKSLTMLLGFGPEMNIGGRTCDFCAMKETCSFQHQYEPEI